MIIGSDKWPKERPPEIPIKEGLVLFRPEFKDHLCIFRVETHKLEGKKKVKLDKPVFHIEYLLNHKKPFTTYLSEVERMIAFERWVKILH